MARSLLARNTRYTIATAELIPCPNCGATNRVPANKLERGLIPVCGKCKAKLTAPAGPVVVTDATFAAEVEQSSLPVLVDFWALWCGPCRMIAPTIDKLATEMAGRARFAKLNIDDNPRTASRFNVSSIPTLLIIKAGREVERIVGLQPGPEIARRLENTCIRSFTIPAIYSAYEVRRSRF